MEWKPFLVGFRAKFGGGADVVIAELAGELQYFRKIFLDGFSEVVEKCGKLDGDCG